MGKGPVVSEVVEWKADPRPFLKWAGGKTRLLPEILARFPKEFNRYFEPFLGGGAVFFALRPKCAILSDANRELIDTCRAIRDDPSKVISFLSKHKNTERHYYSARLTVNGALGHPGDIHERAARMIYLNRTCFNGLYRVNKSGGFNVPFGRYANPKICDQANLLSVSRALQGTRLAHRGVFETCSIARERDLVYLDPPYDGTFPGYGACQFGGEDQETLAHECATMAARGVHIVASNSDTPFIRNLYRDFRVEVVSSYRSIAPTGAARGKVGELLISSHSSHSEDALGYP